MPRASWPIAFHCGNEYTRNLIGLHTKIGTIWASWKVLNPQLQAWGVGGHRGNAGNKWQTAPKSVEKITKDEETMVPVQTEYPEVKCPCNSPQAWSTSEPQITFQWNCTNGPKVVSMLLMSTVGMRSSLRVWCRLEMGQTLSEDLEPIISQGKTVKLQSGWRAAPVTVTLICRISRSSTQLEAQ